MVNKVTLIGDSENFTKYLVILLFQEPTHTRYRKLHRKAVCVLNTNSIWGWSTTKFVPISYTTKEMSLISSHYTNVVDENIEN